jgi:hypothetical protein
MLLQRLAPRCRTSGGGAVRSGMDTQRPHPRVTDPGGHQACSARTAVRRLGPISYRESSERSIDARAGAAPHRRMGRLPVGSERGVLRDAGLVEIRTLPSPPTSGWRSSPAGAGVAVFLDGMHRLCIGLSVIINNSSKPVQPSESLTSVTQPLGLGRCARSGSTHSWTRITRDRHF